MTNTIIHEIQRVIDAFPRNFSKKLSKEQIEYIENNVDPKVKDYKFAMKVYWVLHDIHEFPECKTCGNPVVKPIKSIPHGYYEDAKIYRFCSTKCACKSDGWIKTHSGPQTPERIQRRIVTNNRKYGGNAPACSKSVVKKMRATKEERYGDSGYNNHAQAVRTCNEKYGVDNPSQVREIQLKKEATCLENHGVRCKLHDGEYMKKVFTDKYGVDNPMKVEEIKERSRQTCRKTYNADCYFQSDEYKTKLPEINKHAHRKWILCWNDDKNHMTFRRGEVDQSELDKWEHVMEFDSKPEIAIFVFCKIEHEMNIEYHPTFNYTYEFNEEKFIYCPDFIINGKFYEFKGEQFFRFNESTGKEELFCPWQSKDKTNEEHELDCQREEAKHQCMIANNVTILRERDIKSLTVEMFQ